MPKKAKRVDRNDKWYVLAKEQGYRSRAAFKLAQIQKEFNLLGGSTRVVLDLCAAPGGWSQVAAKTVAKGACVVAVDLLPIRAIPGVRTLVGDVTTKATRDAVKREVLEATGGSLSAGVDVALCDGAPNVGAAYNKDAYVQNEISLFALKCGIDCGLKRGGAFVTKVYRGADYNALLWAFGRFFERVRAFKPQASRAQSAEIFVVCEKYLAPAKVDPKLFDPKAVFAPQQAPSGGDAAKGSSNKGALLMKWDTKRKRQREGYADDVGISLKLPVGTASAFVAAADAPRYLADHSAIKDDLGSSDEVRACFDDLLVLSRSDVRSLLKWRDNQIKKKKSNDEGASEEKDDGQSPSDDDDDGDDDNSDDDDSDDSDADNADVDKAVEAARTMAAKEARKEKRRSRRKDAKLRFRRAAGIVEGSAVDLDASSEGIFSLAEARGDFDFSSEKNDALLPQEDAEEENEDGAPTRGVPAAAKEEYAEYVDETDREMAVEDQLDEAYKAFADRRATRSGVGLAERLVKKRTRDARAAKAVDDINLRGTHADVDGYVKHLAKATEDDDDDDEEDDEVSDRWFSKSIFKGLQHPLNDDDDDDDDDEDLLEQGTMPKTEKQIRKEKRKKAAERLERRKRRRQDEDQLDAEVGVVSKPSPEDDDALPKTASASDDVKDLVRRGMGKLAPEKGAADEDGFEVVVVEQQKNPPGGGRLEAPMRTYDDDAEDDDADDSPDAKAETLALATMMLRRSKAKTLVDASYNRYAWNDPRDLPEWFVDDETRHYRPQLPLKPEVVEDLKKKFQSLAAKPIKKVAEARARKKSRAKARLAAAKRKAENVANDPDLTPGQKLRAVERAMAKGGGLKGGKIEKPSKVYVVQRKSKAGAISKAGKKGAKNARVTLVDKRLKKDKRAMKANDKKRKKAGGTRKKRGASSSSSPAAKRKRK